MLESAAFDERDPNHKAVQQLFREYFSRDVSVNLSVAHDDDMFAYSCNVCEARPIGVMAYFRAGIGIYDCLNDVARWKFGELSRARSFLDFASGHGRFTRVLASVYPKNQIWAAEILPGAVEFQRKQLGVNSLPSSTVPEEFNPGRQFDFIYVGSLFTHLPRQTFTRWLRRLYDLLTENGILVFTTHGPGHLPAGQTVPEDGFFYLRSTEIASLDTEDYGATIVTERYVQSVIREVTGKSEHWYQSRALGFSQDLWIISKSPLPTEKFVYDAGPQGHLDAAFWQAPNRIHVEGWSACLTPGHTIREVRFLLNGQFCESLRVMEERTDVYDRLRERIALKSGFRGSILLPKPLDPWNDVLSAVATCSGGKRYSVRTVVACTVLQFPQGIGPGWNGTIPPRQKFHNALDYVLDGDWSSLRRRALDMLRGR